MKAIRMADLKLALELAREPARTKDVPILLPAPMARSHLTPPPSRAVLCCPMPDGTMRREYVPQHGAVVVRLPNKRVPLAVRAEARRIAKIEAQQLVIALGVTEAVGWLRNEKALRHTIRLNKSNG